jgi:hypothetical protein
MPTLPSTPSRVAAQTAHERTLAIVVEMDLDRCNNTFGVAPCTATGTKCYNTRVTCKDPANYARGTYTYRFGLRGAPIPPGVAARPYIIRADAASTVIDPEAGLARRNSLRIVMADEADSDLDQDPYADTRAAPAQGSWWARLIARNPNIAGRFVRVRRGFAVEPWDWTTFLDELYIVERLSGPDRDGEVELALKDPIKLTDRTKVPAATDGKLQAALQAYEHRGEVLGATSNTLQLTSDASPVDDLYNGMEAYVVSGIGAGQRRPITDYVGETRTATVAPWAVTPDSTSACEISALSIALPAEKGAQYADPATSGKPEYVRIGEEVIEYTAKTGDTLSWATSAARARFGTERKTHAKDAQVQLCRAFIDRPVTEVVQALLQEGGLAIGSIDTASLSAAETQWYGDQFRITCCLSEPETVSDLLADLLPQISAALWWSPQTQKAQLLVLLPGQSVPVEWTDAANLMLHSVSVEVLEDLRLTFAAAYYSQASATSNRREAKHYRAGEILIDTDAESANEYGDRRTAVIYSRWFGPANEVAVRALVRRQVASRRDAPRRLVAQLDPRDYTLPAGEQVDITTRHLVDETGAPRKTRCLVTKVEDKGTHIAVEARTLGFRSRYGGIAPNGTADYPTDTVYAHITQASGLMGNGDPGYYII